MFFVSAEPPTLCNFKAQWPTAVDELPTVFVCKAEVPIAVFWEPVVIAVPAA